MNISNNFLNTVVRILPIAKPIETIDFPILFPTSTTLSLAFSKASLPLSRMSLKSGMGGLGMEGMGGIGIEGTGGLGIEGTGGLGMEGNCILYYHILLFRRKDSGSS